METRDTTTGIRLRYSLISLLLLMTVIALSLALLNETFRRLPLKRKLERLQREVGAVMIAEPSTLYVQPLNDSFDSRLQSRWRAYVPPGRKGEVVVAIQQPDKNRIGRLMMALDAGESGFELIAVPPIKGQGTAWMYHLRQPMSSRAVAISGPPPPWISIEVAERGLEFANFDSKLGAAEGRELTLMNVSEHTAEVPVRIVVSVKHYPKGKSPRSTAFAGHSKLFRSQPVQVVRPESASE